MKNLKLSIDSGAHSLYRTTFSPSKAGSIQDKELADYSQMKDPRFQKYLENYIAFLHEVGDKLEMYVSLDIIFNAKASWEMQKYMEQNGLSPVPVFHQGEPWKYLKRYVDNYEYIGLGGLAQNASARSYIRFADEAFKIICDKKGRPKNKVHGFAMTSVELMRRYPWYSCDSSTWISMSRNGWVRFPRIHKNGSYGWLEKPIAWRFTDRAKHSPVHIDKEPELHQSYMREYLEQYFEMSVYELRHEYMARDVCNIGHSFLVGEALKKYYAEKFDYEIGGNVYIAGHGQLLTSARNFKRVLSRASKPLSDGVDRHYLGSYFYEREMRMALKGLDKTKRRKLRGL